MADASQKIGFWSVFALVTGSQIGSSVLMAPANLAPYGYFGILGWLISGIGAIALALVFARLCAWFPQTGGPHVYVKEAFGSSAAFFAGWTYWVISWVSTTVVVIASVGYLLPIIGKVSPTTTLFLEIILLCAITALNFRGVGVAGRIEFFLTIFKFVPLLIVPLCALYFFKSSNFVLDPLVADLSTISLLSRVTMLTLWGFIGLEAATTAAGSVENPSKTIPRAVIAGTISVAALYVLNSLAIMGVIPGSQLMLSNAPYVDATQALFGGSWHLLIALVAACICLGTLNAWVLTSGQIALGLTQDGLMPAWFGRKNCYEAPVVALAISCIGMIPLLIMTMNESLAAQAAAIIDISVTSFLFVYLACCLAFFKLLAEKKDYLAYLYGCIAFIFCSWIIYQTSLATLLIASCFTLSGIPFYLWLRSRA